MSKNRQKVLTGSDKFGNMDKLSQDNGHAHDDEDMTFREMRTKLKKVVDKQSDMRYNEKARQERMPEGHKHK